MWARACSAKECESRSPFADANVLGVGQLLLLAGRRGSEGLWYRYMMRTGHR